MPPVRVLILALCLTSVSFSQSDKRLLGQWSCVTHETVKTFTGAIISDSEGENTLEFRDDQTAFVSEVARSGKTILRVSGRWSVGPKKLTLQVPGEPSFSGTINKADSLILQAQIPTGSPDIRHLVEWTCNKRP